MKSASTTPGHFPLSKSESQMDEKKNKLFFSPAFSSLLLPQVWFLLFSNHPTNKNRLFTRENLIKHWQHGEGSYNAGHPRCEFCKKRLFDIDHHWTHMRTVHQNCNICEVLGRRDVFLRDMGELHKHYCDEHYVCEEEVCVRNNTFAFKDEIDLRAHVLKTHGQSVPKGRARQVGVSCV